LTTPKVWSLDPTEPNPAQVKWVLSRDVRLHNLKTEVNEDGSYRLNVSTIESETASYLRNDGPWYRLPSDYPCHPTAQSVFTTRDGARVASDEAAKVWQSLLEREKSKLAAILSRVSGHSEKTTIEAGQDLFQRWLKAITDEWRVVSADRAHQAEQEFYKNNFHGQCQSYEVPRENVLEPVAALYSQFPLARAPARRWDGAYSIRLTLVIDQRRLVGQFLIDSTFPKSVVSPDFLEAQGVIPGAVFVPLAEPEKVGKTLARPARVDQVEVAGYKLPSEDFLVAATDFYSPPDSLSSCCDGVIGTDILRHFAVGFKTLSSKISEVDFFDPLHFKPEGDFVWNEVALSSKNEPVSSCQLVQNGKSRLEKITWDLANTEPFRVNAPFYKGENISIECGDQKIASELLPVFESELAGSGASYAHAGVDVLSRGEFVLDLPNGRLWLERSALKKSTPKNRTGIDTTYDYLGKDRVLRVASVRSTRFSQPAIKAGLRIGQVLTSVDGKPADEMDAWEVDQRLSFVYSERVRLGWETKKGSVQVEIKQK